MRSVLILLAVATALVSAQNMTNATTPEPSLAGNSSSPVPCPSACPCPSPSSSSPMPCPSPSGSSPVPCPSVSPAAASQSPSPAAPSPSGGAASCQLPDATCQTDCIYIKPTKMPKPSVKPTKTPTVDPPEFYTIEIEYTCDAVPDLDCCDFYDTLPSATSGKWRLCGPGSGENRKPAVDGTSCSLFIFAEMGGANGISADDFTAAQTSIKASTLCTGADCTLQTKEGQSYAKIIGGDASSFTVSVVLLVASVLALAL